MTFFWTAQKVKVLEENLFSPLRFNVSLEKAQGQVEQRPSPPAPQLLTTYLPTSLCIPHRPRLSEALIGIALALYESFFFLFSQLFNSRSNVFLTKTSFFLFKITKKNQFSL